MRDEDKSKAQLIRELREMREKTVPRAEEQVIRISAGNLLGEIGRGPGVEHFAIPSKLHFVQEQERKRIAGELHDSLGSLLTAIKINLERVRNLMTSGEFDPASLENPIHLTQLAIQEVRKLIFDLRPSLLDDLGLIAAMNWLCGQIESSTNISIDRRIEVEESQIPENLKIVVFRILQEAFHNVAKYSNADFVELAFITSETALELTLRDHGIGFDIGSALMEDGYEKGLGLTMMKERTEFSGGSFSIESISGKGTTIRALWPNRVWSRKPGRKSKTTDTQPLGAEISSNTGANP